MNPPYVTEEMAKAFQEEQQRWGIVEPGLGNQSRFDVIHVEQIDGKNEARPVMSFGLQNEAIAYHAIISVRAGIAAAIKAAGGWDGARSAVLSSFGDAALVAAQFTTKPYETCERLGLQGPETGQRECPMDGDCICDAQAEHAEAIVLAIAAKAREIAGAV